MTPSELEKAYHEFSENFQKCAPDGIIEIDLEALCEMGLINKEDFDHEDPDEVTHYFHVLETPDKITLHNDKFAIWIVPKIINDVSTTHTYISQIHKNKNKPHLELVYANAGVYNTPKFILKVLQHFLIDMIDTDAVISSIGKKS